MYGSTNGASSVWADQHPGATEIFWENIAQRDICVWPLSQQRVWSVQCAFGEDASKCRVRPPGALVRATFNMRNRFLELLTPHQCNSPLPPPSLSLPPSCLTLNVTFRNSPKMWSLSTSYQRWCSYMRPAYDPFYLLSSSFLQWAPLGPVDPIVRRGDSSKLPLLPPGPPLTWVSEWVASAGVSCCRLSAPISESSDGVGCTQLPSLPKFAQIWAGRPSGNVLGAKRVLHVTPKCSHSTVVEQGTKWLNMLNEWWMPCDSTGTQDTLSISRERGTVTQQNNQYPLQRLALKVQ